MSGFTSVVESTFCSLSPQTALVRPFSASSASSSSSSSFCSSSTPHSLFFFYSFRYRSWASTFASPVAWEISGHRFKMSRHGSWSGTRLNLRWTSRFFEICLARGNLSREISSENLKRKRNWWVGACVHACVRGTLQRYSTLFARSVHMLTQWYDSKIYRSGRRGAEVGKMYVQRQVGLTKFTLATRTANVLPGKALDVSILTKVLYAFLHAARKNNVFYREWHWLFSFQGDDIKSTFVTLPSSDSRRFCLSAEVARRVPNESFKVRKMLALFFFANTIKGSALEKTKMVCRVVLFRKDLSSQVMELRLIYADRFSKRCLVTVTFTRLVK